MTRIRGLALAGCAALALAPTGASVALAGHIHQSPLLMRRAGPSCRAGHLGGAPHAGYRWLRGPCRGVDRG
ncbi:hypothetical protein [Lichenibacterium dinghuense]|uniref:hypothetical protein n=1 Tax=Lichenibacterium dinghuense TaxID=2895977 RepID=UPI001F280E95|nr:hypothetical protein [Lichenibacterium sp. 6Y81]